MTDRSLYRIHGLTVSSPWTLPEAESAASGEHDPQVTVLDEPTVEAPAEFTDEGNSFELRAPNVACYAHQLLGTFEVESGAEIRVAPGPTGDEAALRVGLLGPSLGIALIQRGELVLHASAVEVEGRAVAFVGPRGHGKSTMAAAMVARGHHLVSDDVLTVDFRSEPGRPHVVPGYPQVKLWPDAAEALGYEPEDLELLYSGVRKRVVRCFDRFVSTPRPLARIYLLLGGPEIASHPTSPTQAFQILSSMWFGARFGEPALQLVERSHHFKALSELARDVPVQICQRLQNWSSLHEAAHLVEEEMRSRIAES